MREAVLMKVGRFMKSHGAISGAQREHQLACRGGCQTAAIFRAHRDVAPLFAAWAKAHINPLAPGAAIQPALSAQPEAESLAPWWQATPVDLLSRSPILSISNATTCLDMTLTTTKSSEMDP